MCGTARRYSPPPPAPASSRSPYPAGAAGLGGGLGRGGGQREDHGEAAAGGVFGFDHAAHRLGQAAGYREAEPDASSVARVAEPAEGLEHPLPFGRRDAGPVIDHAQSTRFPAVRAVSSGGAVAGE